MRRAGGDFFASGGAGDGLESGAVVDAVVHGEDGVVGDGLAGRWGEAVEIQRGGDWAGAVGEGDGGVGGGGVWEGECVSGLGEGAILESADGHTGGSGAGEKGDAGCVAWGGVAKGVEEDQQIVGIAGELDLGAAAEVGDTEGHEGGASGGVDINDGPIGAEDLFGFGS